MQVGNFYASMGRTFRVSLVDYMINTIDGLGIKTTEFLQQDNLTCVMNPSLYFEFHDLLPVIISFFNLSWSRLQCNLSKVSD